MSLTTPDILKPHYPEPNIFCVQNYPDNRFGVNERIPLKWHPSFKEWYYEDCSFTALENWFLKFPHLFLFHDSIFPPAPYPEPSEQSHAQLKEGVNEENKGEDSCEICHVPKRRHGTACGWDNATISVRNDGTILTPEHPYFSCNINEWINRPVSPPSPPSVKPDQDVLWDELVELAYGKSKVEALPVLKQKYTINRK